ncbi:MAG TPA: hypothetical protein VH834_16715 [Solirubrobacteraceae bacterium]|jgi:hypothetical protein
MRLLRRGLPGLLAAVALGAMPAAASADGLSIGLDGCGSRTVEQPFARWLDYSNYVLVPGGTMEGALNGWKLTGGAKIVAGSEPYDVHGGRGDSALLLPSGSSATTPTVCAAVLDPTLRYFAANDGGLLSLLNVQILYHPPGGGVITLPLGLNAGGRSWAPSLPTIVAADLLGALDGGKASVAFRFTPIGLGAKWRIDDVYLDPRMAR